MERDQIHLIANLLLALIVFFCGLVLIWNTDWLVWFKVGLALLSLILAAFFAHRIAPLLTGRWVDRIFDWITRQGE